MARSAGLFVGLFIIFLTACESTFVASGPLKTFTFVQDKGEVTHANIEFDMKAGELRLTGGSDKLLEAKFEYNVEAYKPSVHKSINDARATITIEQPKIMAAGNSERNTWDLRLSDDPVLDLSLNCGAGKVDLNAGSLQLRSLNIHLGAGQVNLDLNGHPKRDYEVDIAGGIGEATVHLPHDVGVRADVHGGLGSIKVEGLEKRGDHYENSLYDVAKVNVRVNVSGGIGEIRLED